MPNSDDRERTANTAADAVEGMVDNVQAAFQGRKKEERH